MLMLDERYQVRTPEPRERRASSWSHPLSVKQLYKRYPRSAHLTRTAMPSARRFPPPWTVDELNDACYVVRDATGAGARLFLLRGGAGTALGGEPADQGRGAAHGGELRQAAGVAGPLVRLRPRRRAPRGFNLNQTSLVGVVYRVQLRSACAPLESDVDENCPAHADLPRYCGPRVGR